MRQGKGVNMYYKKWKPSKTAAREFATKMNEIDDFCRENGISQSASGDSYCFSVDGQNYRISNHSVEESNRHAYNDQGEKMRELYHEGGRREDTIYIHASKTRIIEIYTAIKAGKILDGRGYEKY